MKTNFITMILAFSLLSTAFAGGGESGGKCDNSKPNEEEQKKIDQHMQVLYQIVPKFKRVLKERDVKVAIIARAGNRPNKFRLPDGTKVPFNYGHSGIVYKNEKGKYRVKHLLYDGCLNDKKGAPFLTVQKLIEFWSIDVRFYDISVKIPSVELQERILAVINDEEKTNRLFNDNYNAVANPFHSKYQNSNGWVLSMITSGMTGADNFIDSQIDFKARGYVPLQTKLTSKEKFGIRFGMKPKNVRFDDKPKGWERSDYFDFYSSESLVRFLDMNDPSSEDHFEFNPFEEKGVRVSSDDIRTSL